MLNESEREPVRTFLSFFFLFFFFFFGARRSLEGPKSTRHTRAEENADGRASSACPREGTAEEQREREKEEEAHLVDDAAGQSVRPPPPRGNAAARHPDQRADKLSRREGEYARVGSPVHRTVFRRELSPPEGGSTEGATEKERGQSRGGRGSEKGITDGRRERKRERERERVSVASKQPLLY